MKLLVFSDSHGSNAGMFYCIEREAPNAVIHLGDYTEDADELRRSYPSLPVHSVRGNNDFDPDRPLEMVFSPCGVSMYLTHGHRQRVSMSSCGTVPQRAADRGCALALFGHTHRTMCEKHGGVWVCNPGSISLPRGGAPSYIRLSLSPGKLDRIELLEEDGRLMKSVQPE